MKTMSVMHSSKQKKVSHLWQFFRGCVKMCCPSNYYFFFGFLLSERTIVYAFIHLFFFWDVIDLVVVVVVSQYVEKFAKSDKS